MTTESGAAPEALSDETGSYPALAGCIPARLGRRAAARAVDIGIVLALSVAMGLLVVWVGRSTPAVIGAVDLVLIAALAGMFVYFGRTGYLPGGRLLAVRQVRVDTGGSPGLAGFAKYLLISVVSALTLGIGYVVTVLMIRPPLNRAWHDTVTGLIVLDVASGRNPGIAPVQPVATATAEKHAELSATAVAPGGPDQTPVETGWPEDRAQVVGAAGPATTAVGPIVSVAADDRLITDVPWRTSPAAPARRDGPVLAPDGPVPTVEAPDSGEGPLEEHTVLAPDLLGPDGRAVGGGGGALIADDGTTIDVDGTIVLGRNPAAIAGFAEARLCPVDDPAMSMSKTHAAVGPEHGGVWVEDLSSTNGTVVTTVAGTQAESLPGGRVLAPFGTEVRFGDRRFKVVQR